MAYAAYWLLQGTERNYPLQGVSRIAPKVYYLGNTWNSPVTTYGHWGRTGRDFPVQPPCRIASTPNYLQNSPGRPYVHCGRTGRDFPVQPPYRIASTPNYLQNSPGRPYVHCGRTGRDFPVQPPYRIASTPNYLQNSPGRPYVHCGEDEVIASTAVRVGERHDTLPPGYRFKNEPGPLNFREKEKPSLDHATAMDMLSEDFIPCVAVPANQTANVTSTVCSKQEDEVIASTAVRVGERHDTLPPGYRFKNEPGPLNFREKEKPSLDHATAMDMLSEDFIPCVAVPANQTANVTSTVCSKQEDEVIASTAVRVGERHDTLPPGYRFKNEPGPLNFREKEKPSLDHATAMDMLSEDFIPCVAVPANQTANVTSTVCSKQEDEVIASTAVRVGERQDTLPPGYRL